MGMQRGHVANTAEALKQHAEKEKKTGKTIKVRAIAKGYYGLPLADIIEAGQEFQMRVADLKPKDKKRTKYFAGSPIRYVTVEGKEYELPSWCVDAKTPRETEDDEDQTETTGRGAGEEVL